MESYDDAAFEKFCGDLANDGFSPVRHTGQRMWSGPLRPSLEPLTDSKRMQVVMRAGWPLEHARVVVNGLRSEHAAHGTVCLWADDDPAQIVAQDLHALWARLDEWAALAQQGFRVQDRALDAYLLFDTNSGYQAELPFMDLIKSGSNGYVAALEGSIKGGTTLIIKPQPSTRDTTRTPTEAGDPVLRGAFYLRGQVGTPPRNLDDLQDRLTRRQTDDLTRGLANRTAADILKPSGGYDFIVLAWPRHDKEHDAVVIGFDNHGTALRASALAATSNDITARQRRAGPDAHLLTNKKVLLAGAGSVGGHVAVALASSGVGYLHLHDSDYLKSGNLVRHVCPEHLVGYKKTIGVAVTIGNHAPWTTVTEDNALPHNPTELAAQIEGFDLVIDCTGLYSMTAALAETCRLTNTSYITGALFHQGAIARIRRQAAGDNPVAARHLDPAYYALPPNDPTQPTQGFLELGCTAPINSAPPIAVLTTAAEIAATAIDHLTGRHDRPDERILVHRPMSAPFDRTGTLDPQNPVKPSNETTEANDASVEGDGVL